MFRLPKIWIIPVIFILIFFSMWFFAEKTSSSFKTSKPYRVGLQVGHWKADQLPEELKKIRHVQGASAAGKMEWEVNLAIAKKTASLLRKHGVTVDILPATIPPGYSADAFIAIHADQNPDPKFTGFKTAPALNQVRSLGENLSGYIEDEYHKVTGMKPDNEITLAMTRYYAFNFRKFKHSVSPQTPAVILETGFLSNLKDQEMLINYPEISARAIANGILRFLYKSLDFSY